MAGALVPSGLGRASDVNKAAPLSLNTEQLSLKNIPVSRLMSGDICWTLMAV